MALHGIVCGGTRSCRWWRQHLEVVLSWPMPPWSRWDWCRDAPGGRTRPQRPPGPDQV